LNHILITGGAGYIGSHLVPILLHKGFSVTVLDNFMYGQPSLSRHCRNDNFQLVVGDVRDKYTVRELVKRADVVIPLAAIVGAPACEQKKLESYETNVLALTELTSRLSKDQLLIFPSTNSVYGVGESGRQCDESTQPNPISSYAVQKLEGEVISLSHEKSICTRFATLFGVSDRMRLDLLINDFVNRAVIDQKITLYEGEFKRNFLHVLDAARSIEFLIDHFSSEYPDIVNFGIPELNLNKRELCNLIRHFIPSLKVHEDEAGNDPDQRNYLVSNNLGVKLGFKYEVSIESGIEELIKATPMFQNGTYRNV
jgi:nucleoside-diphosphate-sugar epimerase